MSSYVRTYKIESTYELWSTYERTYEYGSKYKRTYEYGSRYKHTYNRSYVRFFAPETYMSLSACLHALMSVVSGLWCFGDNVVVSRSSLLGM